MGKTKQNGVLHRLRKNIMCGVLGCALTLGMMLAMPGMMARAANHIGTYYIEGIKYHLYDDGIAIIDGHDSNIGSEVHIPATIKYNNQKYQVTEIMDNAFTCCTNIKKVILEEGLEQIGSAAFQQTNITEIEIPASVRIIDSYVFANCNVTKIRFKGMEPPDVTSFWLDGVNNNNITIEIPKDADIKKWSNKIKVSESTIQTYDPTASSSTSSTTSSSPNQEKNNSNGETEFIEEEPVNHIPEHVCQYEWEVVREVSADQDGLEQYLCKLCGNVQSTLTIPASQHQVQEFYTKVTGAAEGETVTYDTGLVHTVCDKLFTKLQQRKDITLVITYQYKGENYRTTFPAGADYTELLQDADQFYGMLGLNGRCGIVTEKN